MSKDRFDGRSRFEKGGVIGLLETLWLLVSVASLG